MINPCPAKARRGFFICTFQEKRLFLSSCFSICARSNPLGSNIERGFKEVFIWFFGVYFARSAVCGSGFFISAIPPKSRELKPCWHPVFYSIKKYVSKGIAN